MRIRPVGLALWVVSLALAPWGWSSPTAPAASANDAVLAQIQKLNQIPEDQLSDKMDPCLSILRTLNDIDGPEFLATRTMAARQDVRATLTPGARAVLAGLLGPRWDAFNIAGNLWLGGLKSSNTELQEKARRKLVQFAQPSYIPVLIQMLSVPRLASVAADTLSDITGQSFGTDAKAWTAWWAQNKSTFDLVGRLLKDVRAHLLEHPIAPLNEEHLWYVIDGVSDKDKALEDRSPQEQELVQQWNRAMAVQIKTYIDAWAEAKPNLERVTHHPDPRVNQLLEALLADAGYGDYASVILAWRQSAASLGAMRTSYQKFPTVTRALARGSLGDKQALVDLLAMVDHSGKRPLSFRLMDDSVRALLPGLRSVGVIPAEQALEMLCHRSFGFENARTGRDKRKRFDQAREWLQKNIESMTFDPRRGFFVAEKS